MINDASKSIFKELLEQTKMASNSISLTIQFLRAFELDRAIRQFQSDIVWLTKMVETLLSGDQQLEDNNIQISQQYVMEMLSEIMNAQQQKDYILLADLLDLKVNPFCYEIISLTIAAMERLELTQEIFTNFFDINMDILRKKDSELVFAVEQYIQSKAYEVNKINYQMEMTNSGYPTVKIQKDGEAYYFYSNTNPFASARNWVVHQLDETKHKFKLLGFGLGYPLARLVNKVGTAYPVSVYETDIHMLVLGLQYINLARLLQSEQITIYYDPLLKILTSHMQQEDDQLLIYPPALRNIENHKVRMAMERFFISQQSIQDAFMLLNGNFLYNKNFAKEHPEQIGYIDDIKNNIKGKDIYIIAAGPSLDKNIHLLKNKPDNSIIISTGTVFKKLIHIGIDIDYVIVSDANERVRIMIEGLEEQPVPMLLLSTATYHFVKNYKHKKYFIFQKDYPLAEKEAIKLGVSLYETGGSVSTTALDVAIRLKAKRIIFLGLDLAFTGGLAHANHSSNQIATNQEDLFEVRGFDETPVYADHKFVIYREWIERRIEDCNNSVEITNLAGHDNNEFMNKQEIINIPEFINATEGGSYIEGMKHMKLQEFWNKEGK